METLQSAIMLMKPGSFFASCDLKDAYYSVNVKKTYRKHPIFFFNGECYQSTCLQNCLNLGPRYYTKLLKCVSSQLRKRSFLNVFYIDDTLLNRDTHEECEENVKIIARCAFILSMTTCIIKVLSQVIGK
jgi:hypothetical protein